MPPEWQNEALKGWVLKVVEISINISFFKCFISIDRSWITEIIETDVYNYFERQGRFLKLVDFQNNRSGKNWSNSCLDSDLTCIIVYYLAIEFFKIWIIAIRKSACFYRNVSNQCRWFTSLQIFLLCFQPTPCYDLDNSRSETTF